MGHWISSVGHWLSCNKCQHGSIIYSICVHVLLCPGFNSQAMHLFFSSYIYIIKSVGSHILCFYYQVFSLSIFISKYPYNPNSLLHYLSLKYKCTHPPNSCLKRPIPQPELKSVGSYILCFHHQVFFLTIFISKYPYNPNSFLHYLSLKYKCTHPPNSCLKRPIPQPELKSVGSYILCFHHQVFFLTIFISKYPYNPNSFLHYLSLKYKCTHPPNS